LPIEGIAHVLEYRGIAKPPFPVFLDWYLCHVTGLPLVGDLAPDQRALYIAVLTLVVGVIAVLYG
jgi:hypothetical protein